MTITFLPDPRRPGGDAVQVSPATGTGVPTALYPGHTYEDTNTGNVYIALPIEFPLPFDVTGTAVPTSLSSDGRFAVLS